MTRASSPLTSAIHLPTCAGGRLRRCLACGSMEKISIGDEVARGQLMPGLTGRLSAASRFTQGTGGLLLYVEVESLTPGGHGIHLHSVGACSPDFKASGGHINTGDEAARPAQPRRRSRTGDLPNIYAAADGTARAEIFTTLVRPWTTLLDDDGSAIVIHAQPDDHITQPIGGAGDRVACGVIEGS